MGVRAGLRVDFRVFRRREPERFDAGRRDAVFVVTYTSITTGRITGLRWVTS